MQRATCRAAADLLHGPAFRVPADARVPTAVTIHDDTPWDDPPTATWWTRTSVRRHIERAAERLSLATVSSPYVAETVIRAVPALEGRIRVTPFGVDHEIFRPCQQGEVAGCLRRLGLGDRYVLVIGPYGPRKNFPAMVDALDRAGAASRRITLVVVGRSPKLSPQAGVPVRYLGTVSDADLARLYSGAQFLFYASLKEGFGFPVLEAMACGCPVLTSQDTVLEELAGGAASLADPRDGTALTRACIELLDGPEVRKRRRSDGLARAAPFSWDAAIASTAAAWREVAG